MHEKLKEKSSEGPNVGKTSCQEADDWNRVQGNTIVWHKSLRKPGEHADVGCESIPAAINIQLEWI